MYTPQELEQHRGWGHSTFQEAVTLAADAGVQRLVLFHHEPEHGDADVDGMLTAARREANARGKPAEVMAAQEGTTLTLRFEEHAMVARWPVSLLALALLCPAPFGLGAQARR